MAKLKLVASPTFKAAASIPVAGAESVPVDFIFKHRTVTALDELNARIEAKAWKVDTDDFLEFVEAWDLEEPFTRENAELFLQIYGGAGLATLVAYTRELKTARLGN